MNLTLQHDMLSLYTWWCQGSSHRKTVKVPMCKCFTSLCLCHSCYYSTGQSLMTKYRNTVPLDVKEIYLELERIYGHFSSLLYFIFLSLVLFIYILWLLCGRCLISGYWMNEWVVETGLLTVKLRLQDTTWLVQDISIIWWWQQYSDPTLLTPSRMTTVFFMWVRKSVKIKDMSMLYKT